MSHLKKTRNQIHKSHKLRWDYTYYSCFSKGCATVLFSVFYLFPANMMIWCLKLEEIAFTTFWCFFGFCLRNSAVSPHLRGHYKLPYTINMELERRAKKVWENRCSSASHKPTYHLYVLIVSLSLLDSIKNIYVQTTVFSFLSHICSSFACFQVIEWGSSIALSSLLPQPKFHVKI